MISSWRRWNAIWPSPYSGGIAMPKRPIRQYARSSTRVVSRFAAHDMRCATLKSASGRRSVSTARGIAVSISRCAA